MALENAEVLVNLKQQLEEVTKQLNQLTETRVKLLGAIDVLDQIEESKLQDVEEASEEDPETETAEE
jgi:hypothetical protein|tara:strand:+ start:111 stop:311 length:201 start_codon:yes stop_codon:yes gene_type:complete